MYVIYLSSPHVASRLVRLQILKALLIILNQSSTEINQRVQYSAHEQEDTDNVNTPVSETSAR